MTMRMLSRNKRNGMRLSDGMVDAYAGPPGFQGTTSKRTSRNLLPKIYNKKWVQREHIVGKDVVDLGIGGWPENVTSVFPNVVPRDPYWLSREANERALRGVYDTAIISNVLNVIDDDRAIIELLELARTVADTTLIKVYDSGRTGYTRDGYQRGVPLEAYLPFAWEVFGRENVSIRDGVMVCESWRREFFRRRP